MEFPISWVLGRFRAWVKENPWVSRNFSEFSAKIWVFDVNLPKNFGFLSLSVKNPWVFGKKSVQEETDCFLKVLFNLMPQHLGQYIAVALANKSVWLTSAAWWPFFLLFYTTFILVQDPCSLALMALNSDVTDSKNKQLKWYPGMGVQWRHDSMMGNFDLWKTLSSWNSWLPL